MNSIAIGEFHPVLIHMPIALVILAFFADLSSWILKRPFLLTVGHWFILLAALVLIPTAFTGLYAKEFYPPNDPDVMRHQNMAILMALFVVGYAVLRVYCLTQGHLFSTYLYLFLSFVALSLIGVTADFGGSIVRGKGLLFKSSREEGTPLLYDRVK